MAKPYLIFKAHTGIYYAQIRLADGSLSNNKSTGCRNRTEAERTVMEWIVFRHDTDGRCSSHSSSLTDPVAGWI